MGRNLHIPPKGPWHYDVDRATNRKCWYIVALSTAPHTPNTQRIVGAIGPRSDRAQQASSQRIRTGGRDATHNGKIDGRADRATQQATAQRVRSGGSGRSSRAPRTAAPHRPAFIREVWDFGNWRV